MAFWWQVRLLGRAGRAAQMACKIGQVHAAIQAQIASQEGMWFYPRLPLTGTTGH